MKVKEHYDLHLGNFYSWMTGNFREKQQEQENFFRANGITPAASGIAVDLGAGHGLQAISLARIGFSVYAVDFNAQLLRELESNKGELRIDVIQDDMLSYIKHFSKKAALIVCMGDTLPHLERYEDVEMLIQYCSNSLTPTGKVIFSFRDLTMEIYHEQRFIPVKSDDSRILTCFLEYFPEKVIVHDILHEKQNGKWVQKVSAYPKLRLNEVMITELFQKHDITVVRSQQVNRMIYLTGVKKG